MSYKHVKIRVVTYKGEMIAYHNEIKSIEDAIKFLQKHGIPKDEREDKRAIN